MSQDFKKILWKKFKSTSGNSLDPIELSIIGAAKISEQNSRHSKLEGNFNRISYVFSNISKKYPELFKGMEFDKYGYNERVQRTLDRFIESEVLLRQWERGQDYRVDFRKASTIYSCLKPKQKEVANELGKLFYDNLFYS